MGIAPVAIAVEEALKYIPMVERGIADAAAAWRAFHDARATMSETDRATLDRHLEESTIKMQADRLRVFLELSEAEQR